MSAETELPAWKDELDAIVGAAPCVNTISSGLGKLDLGFIVTNVSL